MVTRRDALRGGFATAALAGATVAEATKVGATPASAATPRPPDLSFLRDTPLMNAERARDFLAREKLDALIVTRSPNVFYVTNHYPQADRMGAIHAMSAVLCRDPARPLAIVAQSFVWYYSHSDESAFGNRAIFTYTEPEDPASSAPITTTTPATAPRQLHIYDEKQVTARERRRRASLASARSNSASAPAALARALHELKLTDARLGLDDLAVEPALRAQGLRAQIVAAEDTLRRIRFAKSPAEVRMMRIATAANREAGLVAARTAREAGSTRVLRARFFAEAALRGNMPLFMVLDGSSSEVMDWPLRDGMALSMDCVSSCRHYHGDFARTIFIGEPPKSMQRATKAISIAWGEVREQLKAGMRYSEVRRVGRESLRKQGVELNVSFNTHSVGLFHTDHPHRDMFADARPEDLVLEENTVLSVDCPVLEAGIGGTAHLEDLMLIGKTRSEPLHEIGENVIVV
jgi:Xaa-Pro aminopeptidase